MDTNETVNKVSWLKALAVLVASISAEKAVFDILQAVCPKANKLPGRILRGIGIGVIVSMIADKADNYVTGKANQLEAALNSVRASLENCTPARFDAAGVEDDDDDNRTTEN